METMYTRTEMLIGEDAVSKLKSAHVIVFGCGGVGSYIIEALARAGVGKLTVVDSDCVSVSNINRQLIATLETVDTPKTEAVKARVASINPQCTVDARQTFYTAENADEISFDGADYVADAIDTVTSKLLIIERAKAAGVPVICSMGTGNKLDPTRFRIADIQKTSVCPLARAMRKLLKERGISHVKVLFSDEQPVEPAQAVSDEHRRSVPASISFVPSAAGLIIAGEIIKDIIDYKAN